MKQSSILVKNQPFYFDELDLEYENSKALDKKKAKKNLLLFKDVLDAHHLDFYIMHGTLLGAIREQDFIDFDIDIDTCTNNEKELINLIPILCEVGLKLCRYNKGKIYSFIKDDIYIDVYIYKEAPFMFYYKYCRYLGRLFPKKFFDGFEIINFLNTQFKAPNHSIELLEYWYGKEWRVPCPNCPSNDTIWFEKPLIWIKKKCFNFIEKVKNVHF